jgi:PKD repeat protein
MYNGNLHIEYICDKDAGAAIQDLTAWIDNPVMYLELKTWNPLDTPLVANLRAVPSFGVIPLSVNFRDMSIGHPSSWLWSFGDSFTSSEQNPTHIYNTPGNYDIELIVSNQTESDTINRYSYIHAFSRVVANFSAQPDSGPRPLQVHFTDLSQGNPTSWLWDFGDYSTSSDENPTHAYSDTGYFSVKLIASNQFGADTLVKPNSIHVFNNPLADFSAQPGSGFVPLYVQFTDRSTGNPSSWFWDFGDGDTGNVQNPTHAYGDTGHFDVKLIASNQAGSSTRIKQDYIACLETLTVGFTAQPTRGRKPLTVLFQSLSAPTPQSVTWHFGDGQVTNQLNPVHEYDDLGNYSVTMKAELFGYQDSVTKVDYVRVSDVKAQFAADKRCGSLPLTVNFSDSSIGSYPILGRHWDFGDGNTSSQQNPTHQYTRSGVFDVRLIVADSVGSDTLTKQDYITSQDGVSTDFVGLPHSGRSPLTVMFEPILEGVANYYFWDFGDGDTSSLRNPIHEYTALGKYNVKLKVRLELDDCNQVDSTVKAEYVIVNDLQARFNANPTAGVIPLLVQFTDSSTGSPTTWSWDFGDRHTNILPNPSHQYDSAGIYNVSLRVTNLLGTDSLLKLEYIHVDTPFCDLSAQLGSIPSIPRPGFDMRYYFVWANIGNQPTQNCTLKLLLPSQIPYFSVFVGQIATGTYSGYSISSDTIVIPLSTINPSGWYGGYIYTLGNLPATVPAGETLICKMWLTSSTPEQNYDNNHVVLSQEVRSSIDPNDKLASPEGEGASHGIEPGQRLAYMIQFENKKEATAEAIYVRAVDTLDQDLDWGTFAIGDMSHPQKCSYQFNPYTGVIVWSCDSIMLPPNTNPPQGEGYFTYSISPKRNLPDGTEIANAAWIRFDYNPWLRAPEEGPVIRTIKLPFVRGDANGDRIINAGDVVYLVSYLYRNGPAPNPLPAGDATCNGIVDAGDVVFLVNYLFKGGPAPSC